MNAAQVKELIEAIRAGALTPDQMEDVVMAMDDAYRAHHKHLYQHMSCDLRDVSDEMTIGRENTEALSWEEDAADQARSRRGGYVHTLPNVAGVSLERAL